MQANAGPAEKAGPLHTQQALPPAASIDRRAALVATAAVVTAWMRTSASALAAPPPPSEPAPAVAFPAPLPPPPRPLAAPPGQTPGTAPSGVTDDAAAETQLANVSVETALVRLIDARKASWPAIARAISASQWSRLAQMLVLVRIHACMRACVRGRHSSRGRPEWESSASTRRSGKLGLQPEGPDRPTDAQTESLAVS